MTMQTIAERVIALRKGLGWSQSELARRARVRQQAVSRLEAGEVENPRSVGALAKALGTTADYLIHGTGAAPTGATEADHCTLPLVDRAGDTVAWLRLPRSVLQWRGVSVDSAELSAIQVAPTEGASGLAKPGDVVVLDRSVDSITDAGLYLIELDTRRMLRECRQQLSDGAVAITSASGTMDVVPVPQLARLKVLGRAVLALASI